MLNEYDPEVQDWLPEGYKELPHISNEDVFMLRSYFKQAGIDVDRPYCITQLKYDYQYSKAMHNICAGKVWDVASAVVVMLSERDGRGLQGFLDAEHLNCNNMFGYKLTLSEMVTSQWKQLVREVDYILNKGK